MYDLIKICSCHTIKVNLGMAHQMMCKESQTEKMDLFICALCKLSQHQQCHHGLVFYHGLYSYTQDNWSYLVMDIESEPRVINLGEVTPADPWKWIGVKGMKQGGSLGGHYSCQRER